VSCDEREALERWARRPTTAQALAQRARMILACADGQPNQHVARRERVTRQTVGRWRGRFVRHRLDGLLDGPRPGAPRKITDEHVERVVRWTLETKPRDATHWSTCAMAARSGLTQSAVSRIWRAFALQPHRVATFKLSKDPLFIEKVRDIVGLYLNPPDIAESDRRRVHAILEARRRHPSWGGKKLLTLGHRRHPRWILPGQFRTGDGRYCYPLTVADGFSRYLLGCQALASTAVAQANPILTRLFKEYGLPKRIRTDNGVPFATNTLARLSTLSAWWVRLGILPELIEPGRRAQNGCHERMHRTLKAETTRPAAEATPNIRPHESRLLDPLCRTPRRSVGGRRH
jgi:transposase